MRSAGYFFILLILSILISAGIAWLYLFLLTTGYFPSVGITIWVAAGISALILGILVYQLPFVHGPRNLNSIEADGLERFGRNIFRFWKSSLIGAIAVIANGMMALGGFLSPAAKSTLVLTFFCAMFFAFELIQLAAFAWHRLR
jgi:hypothetical protein